MSVGRHFEYEPESFEVQHQSGRRTDNKQSLDQQEVRKSECTD